MVGDGIRQKITVTGEATKRLSDSAQLKGAATSYERYVNSQTVALIARDGGCSFPGCDRPPEWCERHHIVEWSRGGKTDLDNLTLLCAYHHHNFASRGWTCVMIDGLPAWIPPPWVDRERRPLRHARITARQHGIGLRL